MLVLDAGHSTGARHRPEDCGFQPQLAPAHVEHAPDLVGDSDRTHLDHLLLLFVGEVYLEDGAHHPAELFLTHFLREPLNTTPVQ